MDFHSIPEALAELKKDTDGLWSVVRSMKESAEKSAAAAEQRMKEHEESHRWWAGYVLGGVTLLVALIELLSRFLN